jgi:aryl-alcohol dehydrogenase-like predicted oxidoreductase
MSAPKQGLSRRAFIRKTVGVATAAHAAGWIRPAEGRTARPAPDQAGPVLTRRLGRTGLTLPIVSMGVMNADNPELVRKACEVGIRHFDTAGGYARGRNEQMVGRVLGDLGVRDRAVIATKVYIPGERRRSLSAGALKDEFVRMAEESLARLQTNAVDILYIHDVNSPEDIGRPGFREALADLKKRGKIRFAGFSTHEGMTECLEAARRDGFYDVILTAFNYALAEDRALLGALEGAAAAGIGLIAMKTQCAQDWYKDGLPREQQKFYEVPILHTAVLKWALRHDFLSTAVPGFTTFDQLDTDWPVARGLDYTPEEAAFLKTTPPAALATCVRCGACRPSCPRGADVPALMRARMYAAVYANFGQCRQTLDAIPRDKGLARCLSCGDCRAACVRRVDIGRRIGDLIELFG